jgi:hypothetical protein
MFSYQGFFVVEFSVFFKLFANVSLWKNFRFIMLKYSKKLVLKKIFRIFKDATHQVFHVNKFFQV